MASVDRGISSFVGPRQSGVSRADLLEQPISSSGLYSGNPAKSNIFNLDRDKSLVALAGQSSNSIPLGLKASLTYYKLRARDSSCGTPTYVTWVTTVTPLSTSSYGGALPCGGPLLELTLMSTLTISSG